MESFLITKFIILNILDAFINNFWDTEYLTDERKK